jgi:16S rRNA (uracil1498-N3)-methyltransferase
MRLTRIFENSIFKLNDTVRLSDNSAQHICTVLRLKLNDEIVLFNGDGCNYKAKIAQIGKREVFVHITEVEKRNTLSPLHIHLGQALCRGEKMDFVIQKATELGVQAITPLNTEYSNVKLSEERLDKKQAHWQNVADSAAEQSGRTDRLIVHTVEELNEWFKTPFEGLRLVLEPNSPLSIKSLIKQDSVQLLIGPEGGLSEQEIKEALAVKFTAINLGSRILRTETAALTTSSILQCLWGDI